MQLGILDYVIVAAAADFLENRAQIPQNLAEIDAAIDLFFDQKIVFDGGIPRVMTQEEIDSEELM